MLNRRTNILFDDQLWDQLSNLAKNRKTSVGELVRNAVTEHYELKNIESMINNVGFDIIDIQWIGSHVYEPLANYYMQNRSVIKNILLKDENSSLLSSYFLNISYDLFEKIVYKSALKMKVAYQEGIIDYVLIKARSV